MVKQTKSKFSLGLSKKFLITSTSGSLVLSVLLGTELNRKILHWFVDVLPFMKRGFIPEPFPLVWALYVGVPVAALLVVLILLKVRRPLIIAFAVGFPMVFVSQIVTGSSRVQGAIAVFLLSWIIFFVTRELVKEKAK